MEWVNPFENLLKIFKIGTFLDFSQFWEFFCQPFGENSFSKKRTQNEKRKASPNYKVFQATKLQLCIGYTVDLIIN